MRSTQPVLPLDWNILREPQVADIARRAASFVSTTHPNVLMDADDLFQEAALMLASRPERVRAQSAAGNYGLIAKELQHDLQNKVGTELRRSNRNTSHERLSEEVLAGE